MEKKCSSICPEKATENSIQMVNAPGDDSSALIEFTPLWKTRVSNYPLKLKFDYFSLKKIVEDEFSAKNTLNVSVNSKTAHPPPGNPRAFDSR